MKAKELNPHLFPRKEVVKAYEAVSQEYELTIQDRVWHWFYPLVSSTLVTEQEIEQEVNALYRLKDAKGEWLFYNLGLFGKDWQGNRKDFSYLEGKIDGFPEFDRRIDPATNEVIPGTTQVHTIKTIHTIPFSSNKVDEL